MQQINDLLPGAIEASLAEPPRDIVAIVADFKAADAEAQKHESRASKALGRASQLRLVMAQLVWEARRFWEASKDHPGTTGWGQFSEQQFAKSRAEIDRLLKIGRAEDPAEQLRAAQKRDRERKHVSETAISETCVGETAGEITPSEEGGCDRRFAIITDEQRSHVSCIEHELRDIVGRLRISEISDHARLGLLCYFAKLIGVSLPAGFSRQCAGYLDNAAE